MTAEDRLALATEARERWGDTDAYEESERRTQQYSEADWARMRDETEAIEAALAEAMAAGEPPTGVRAMDLAEQARQHISRWFYECPPAMHRGLGDMYVADPRFTEHYDRRAPGLAPYVREAIAANADRQEA